MKCPVCSNTDWELNSSKKSWILTLHPLQSFPQTFTPSQLSLPSPVQVSEIGAQMLQNRGGKEAATRQMAREGLSRRTKNIGVRPTPKLGCFLTISILEVARKCPSKGVPRRGMSTGFGVRKAKGLGLGPSSTGPAGGTGEATQLSEAPFPHLSPGVLSVPCGQLR